MSNAIKDVLSAERAAESILDTARQEHEQAIAEAKQKGMQLLEQGKARVDAQHDAQLQTHRKQLDAQRDTILKQATAEVAALEQRAKSKIAKSAEQLLRKFEASLE